MKNYCGILEHDYGCNCVGVATNSNIVSLCKEQAEYYMKALAITTQQTPTVTRRQRRANERKNK